ncbi:MAG: AsmA-like C-terminal region-containing protein [Puia sp.]|nr:AsmA-like C-terminal region-containing protein [Puia sp.]
MKNKTRKRLFRLILIPVASLFILVIAAVAILYFERQRLVGLAVEELNKKWPGELVVGGSELSVFQNFPYISIGLQRVRFYAGKVDTARPALVPIYEAEKIFAGFSLTDILKQHYRVKVIAVKNGHLDLLKEKDGELNIVEASHINTDTGTTDSTRPAELDLDIKKIVLKNMDISYRDSLTGQQVLTHIDRIQSSLQDNDRLIDADLKGALVFDYTRPGYNSLFRHKRLETNIQFTYDKPSEMVHLTEGRLKLEDALFNVTGTADLLHDNTVDLHFSGDKPDFRQLFSFAPEEVARELKHFKYDGHLSFSGSMKGALKGGKMPLIEVRFSCADAWLHNTTANKKLDSLAFKGYYTNGAGQSLKTSELRLLDIQARPDKGVFKGNFILRDFTDPRILMQVNSELELGFVGAFLGIKDLERITGHISLKMNFRDLVDFSAPEKELSELTEGIQSELTVRNLTFRVPSYPYIIEHLNLHANMKNGFVKLDSLACMIGGSDFHVEGSLTDLPALFHHQEKPVVLKMNMRSQRMILKELLSFDSTRSRKAKEEIYGFHIGLSLETSVSELLHPKPLPKGVFKIDSFYSAFKNYPHAFHDFGAELTINDTSILLRNFAGLIDSSDIRFSGRVNNYALWFNKVMKGRTQVAFDLKSRRLAMHDLLGRISRQYVPRGYYEEVGSNIWLRSKIDLRYDSVFQFANIKIANISGSLRQHAYRLDSISGNIKFGTDHFLKIDTLKGIIGRSDFNVSMRLYTGSDTTRRKKENFLQFSSRFLDVDELTNYVLTAEEEQTPATAGAGQPEGSDPTGVPESSGGETGTGDGSATVATTTTTTSATPTVTGATVASATDATAVKPVAHTTGFNIFQIPFIDFNATVNIGRIRYHHLGLKNLSTNIRMVSNQQLYLDTLGVEVAEGRVGARGHFNGSDPNKIYLQSRICAEDVNIEKLLLKMDYFGQDYVINKNLKGYLSGQIESYVQVHPDLTPLMDNSEAKLDLEILNGELVNFGPMQAMSSYFKDKNLKLVRFDTLQNTLVLKNGALTIPDMNINSSLGYMEISGKQSLDMKMEYYIRIPLKMVTQVGFRMLFGKRKEEVDPDQVDAIEYRDKDKKIRFMNLKITGTPDDYKVGLGKAKKS